MAEPKDIILLIDGTRQGPDNASTVPTNVEGLACFLKAEPLRNRTAPRPLPGKNGLLADAPGTVVGYLSGVGADTPDGLNLLPAATGLGIAQTIRLAYKFLISHYRPDDRIFLFGFSRGAFAIRSLAGFVDCIGVGLRAVPADKRDLAIEEAYYAYEFLQGDTKMLRENIREYVYEFLAGSTHDQPTPELTFDSLPIYFIGIWDAVAALGLPSKAAFATREFNSYHQTYLPPNVSYAFHALSLHELRSDFHPHVWSNKKADQTLEQRWFAGDHSDIGGGHRTRELADISLAWMLRKAEGVGLTAVRSLSKEIPSPSIAPINQIWQQRPYYLLNPAVRDILKTYSEPAGPTVLCSSFDDTVLDRLASGDIDYSAWQVGFGKRFGIRSEFIQVHALQDVDRHAIRGVLRELPAFTHLDEHRQKELLATMSAANWRDAQAALSKQHGQQLSDQLRNGTSERIAPSKPLKPIRKQPPAP